jgi:hypothetical protein
MDGIVITPGDFKNYTGLLDRLESLPSSQRYFQEVFEKGVYIIKLFGNIKSIFPRYKKSIFVSDINFDSALGIEYSKNIFSDLENLTIIHINPQEDNLTHLELIRKRIKKGIIPMPKILTILNAKDEKITQKEYY